MATIPGLVLAQKNEHPNAISLRYKHLGIWRAYSWTEYLDEISVLAGAYKSRSVGKGTVVAIYGNSIPKLIFTIAAVQSLGGIIVPIHPEATATELKKILNDSNAEILVAEDQQQVDTFHVAEADCKIKDVIYLNGRGLKDYKNANLYSFDEITKKAKPINIELEVKKLKDNDLAFYMYDEFEDAMYSISHEAITNNSKKIIKLNSLTPKDSIVSYLSLSIPTNLLFTYVTSIVSGMSLNLPESNQTIEKDLTSNINGACDISIMGDSSSFVMGDMTSTSFGSYLQTSIGAISMKSGDVMNMKAADNLTIETEANEIHTVAGTLSETITGAITETYNSSLTTSITGVTVQQYKSTSAFYFEGVKSERVEDDTKTTRVTGKTDFTTTTTRTGTDNSTVHVAGL